MFDLKKIFCDFFNVTLIRSKNIRLTRFFGFSALFALSILFWLFELILFNGPVIDADTQSYLTALPAKGEGFVDSFRTPGYPLLLYVFHLIFGTFYQWMIVVFQELLFLLSAIFLWDIARNFVKRVFWVNMITVVYLVLPILLHYDYACILIPESLVITFVVMLLWLLFHCLYDKENPFGWRYPLLITLDLLWLVLLKPVFVYLIVILAIYWGYILFTRKTIFIKRALAGYFGLAIVSAGVFMYKSEFRRLYGYDSISCVTVVNNYFFARSYELLDTTLIENPDLRKLIRGYIVSNGTETDSMWSEIYGISHCGDSSFIEMHNVINASVLKSPRKSLGGIYHRAGLVAHSSSLRGLMNINAHNKDCRHVWIDDYMGGFYTIFIPTFNLLNYFLIVYFLCMVWLYCSRYRKFDFMNWFLWLFVSVGYIVAVFGAMGDWARLTVQILPGVLLMIGKSLSVFKCRLE